MNNILEKLSSYQILINILPGAFVVSMLRFLGLNIPTGDVFHNILLYYFIGLIISRISSLVVEPSLRRCGLIKFKPLSDYIKAEKTDAKIAVLSEINNCFRSFLTGSLILPVAIGLFNLYLKWTWFSMNWQWLAMLFFVVLFFLSYRKQSKYVSDRVEKANDGQSYDTTSS